MSYDNLKEAVLNEKLSSVRGWGRDPEEGYIRRLGYLSAFFDAVSAVGDIISGTWRVIMSPIRGVWNISALGVEKLKSLFTDKPPNYGKIISKSRSAFHKRSRTYRKRSAERRLQQPQKSDQPDADGESQDDGIRSSTKKALRGLGIPTLKEKLVHEMYDVSFILEEDMGEDARQEISSAIREDFSKILSVYQNVTSLDATNADIAEGMQIIGIPIEESDLDFYEYTTQVDPDMPETDRRHIGDETFKLIKKKILPEYFSYLVSSMKKTLKRQAYANFDPDFAAQIDSMIETHAAQIER